MLEGRNEVQEGVGSSEVGWREERRRSLLRRSERQAGRIWQGERAHHPACELVA